MNRTIAVVAFALLTVHGFAAASRATASTDMDKFSKRLAKSAVTDARKPAVLCVCKDGTANQNRAGTLVQVGQLGPGGAVFGVSCFLPQFDVTGAMNNAFACGGWQLLPK